jgi:hypothetical protein
VDYERSIGFTHSHNTEVGGHARSTPSLGALLIPCAAFASQVNWDTWISKGKAAVKGDDGVTTGE